MVETHQNVDYIQRFKSIVERTIHRRGIVELMQYLENETDFFTQPASIKYHGNYPGGLVRHSLNTYKRLLEELNSTSDIRGIYFNETIAIVALFHDVYKCDLFVRTDTGYAYNENSLQLGNGEKSLYILQKFMKLADIEAMTIRWHMGAFDAAAMGGDTALNKAFDMELPMLLHFANMKASRIDELQGDKLNAVRHTVVYDRPKQYIPADCTSFSRVSGKVAEQQQIIPASEIPSTRYPDWRETKWRCRHCGQTPDYVVLKEHKHCETNPRVTCAHCGTSSLVELESLSRISLVASVDTYDEFLYSVYIQNPLKYREALEALRKATRLKCLPCDVVDRRLGISLTSAMLTVGGLHGLEDALRNRGYLVQREVASNGGV